MAGKKTQESGFLSGPVGRSLDSLFELLASLKLAVIVIIALTASLATATVLESIYDTPTAQYFVYRSLWFHGVLAALGVNIFCVAVSRWPWQRRHIPFLLAHLGILILLAGSWVTEKFGLDGSARVGEGEFVSFVDLDQNSLVLTDSKQVRRVHIPWIPPNVEFKPISVKDLGMDYELKVDQFLSHADANYSFIPKPALGRAPLAAAHMRLQGGPMNITQDFWLWEGDAMFRVVQMGPSTFSIGNQVPVPQPGRPSFSLIPEASGGYSYRAISSSGDVKEGKVSASEAKGSGGVKAEKAIEPGWKGGVKLTVLEWIPSSVPLTHYSSARVQYGMQAPAAAIHVISGAGGPGAETWLGLGDRAALHTAHGDVELAYLPNRISLPFTVRLDRFQIDRYEGSMDPSSYSSRVTLFQGHGPNDEGQTGIVISMNEPLTAHGVTFYQSSYEDARPRPTVSIFSVNQDPGRFWKYLGSLLIVLGSIMLFAVKYRKARVEGAKPRLEQEVVL